MDLSGFAVFDFSEGIPYFSVTSNGVTFNRAVTLKLGTPAFVRLLINESTRQVALQVCDESTPKAVAFCALERTRFGGNFQTSYGIRFTAWISCER